MAAALVRSCTQSSLLRQPIIHVIRRDLVKNHILQPFSITCVQYQYYHVTPICYKEAKKKKTEGGNHPIVLPSMKKKLPEIKIWQDMTVLDLAESAQRDIGVVKTALSLVAAPKIYTDDTVLDKSVTQAVVKKLGGKIKQISVSPVKPEKKNEDVFKRPPPDESVLIKRHPVVTIMGHVDHGKTTLLDTLRDTSVVATEFGGITQHIGAFNVTLKSGERITFLDTPGHAAFSAMRARGAHVTDIVVLVVAADDGVMEQTVQSIKMAMDANVPIIVAINKIDKPQADIERTKRMLSQEGILVEDLGGPVQAINISALKGTNVDTLVEAIYLQAELMNLRGDPTGLVEGVVIECSNHPGRGKLATVLIQRGTLQKGDVLVSGTAWAKVRSIFDHVGNSLLKAKLSEAVQIIGWRELPEVGDEILEVESEQKANMVMRYRAAKKGSILAEEHKKAADERLQEHLIVYKKELQIRRTTSRYRRLVKPSNTTVTKPESSTPRVNVILKGDVGGSVEAILDVLGTYNDDDNCRLNVVHYGVGDITETDIEMAETFDAIIFPFNVTVPHRLKDVIEQKNISVRPYNVIYKLVENVRDEINKKLPLVDVEKVIGEAKVLQQFLINEGKKKVSVAGCCCVMGALKKSEMFRLMRGEEVIHTGKLSSMRHLKEEVSSIKLNTECGLKFEDATVSFQPGDKLICFKTVEEPQETRWDPGF